MIVIIRHSIRRRLMNVHHIGHRLVKYRIIRYQQLLHREREIDLLGFVEIEERLDVTLRQNMHFVRPPREERDIGYEAIVLKNDSPAVLEFALHNIAEQASARGLMVP